MIYIETNMNVLMISLDEKLRYCLSPNSLTANIGMYTHTP